MVAPEATQVKVLVGLRGSAGCVLFAAVACLLYSSLRAYAQDPTVVGTPEQANERIRELGQASKTSPHEYTIGNGDLLGIVVFDVPELTRDVRVSRAGTIALPLVPTRLHIAGLTEIQARQAIADVLEANGLVSHPQVEVTAKERRSRPITVVGAVQHPMVYQADSDVTLLEVLAAAGGIANDAGDTIIVTRPRAALFIPVAGTGPLVESAPGTASSASGATSAATATDDKEQPSTASSPAFPSATQLEQTPAGASDSSKQTQTPAPLSNIISINLNELLEKGDMQNNIPVQPGDVVTVPHAGIVYVLGAVARPGGFVLSNDRTQLTTLKILALAGGQTRTAKLDHAYIVRKDNQGKQTATEVDLKKILHLEEEDLPVRASDILYIPDSKTKAALYQVLQIAVAVGTGALLYRVQY
jgi:polysaccharide export outer membrane protein